MNDIARVIIQKLGAMAGQVAKSAIMDPYTIACLEGGRGEPVLLIHGFALIKHNKKRGPIFIHDISWNRLFPLPIYVRSCHDS